MGRKIKHYSSGYQIRRKKQRRVLGSLLFGLLLVFLVFVGYVGARALNEMRLQQGNDSSLPESSVVTEDNSSLPESDSLSSESEVSSNEESESSQPESSCEAETLYTKYGDTEGEYTPVKEDPFTKYGAPVAAYIPLPDIPKSADDEELKAVTMPLGNSFVSRGYGCFSGRCRY